MSPRLSVLDFNGFAQFRMIAILLVVYQGMVRLGENGRNGEIGLMVGSYMCSICITWSCVEGYEVSKSAWWNCHHWSSQTCDLFWNSDVTWTSTMDFPPLFCPSILRSTYHEKHVTLLILLSLLNCWAGNPSVFSCLHPPPKSKKHCSHCHFLPDLCDLEQATPCANIFVPVQLPRCFRGEKFGPKVIQPTTSSNQRHTKLGIVKKGRGWKVHITPPLNQKWREMR